MLILHVAAWAPGFFLWGEASLDEIGHEWAGNAKTGRPGSRAEDYPYDAGPAALAWALKDLPLNLTRLVSLRTNLKAWLPCRGRRPLPSGPLVDETAEFKGRLVIRPCTVSGYGLEPQDAIVLLGALSGRRLVSNGVLVGRDAAFWTQALEMAGILLAGQQVLPDVQEKDGQYLGVWRPFFSENDQADLESLARRMPPAARAVTGLEAKKPPRQAGLDVLKTQVGVLVDHLAREALKEEHGTGTRKKKAGKEKSPQSLHDAWLAALKAQNPAIPGTSKGLAALADQVREWSRPLALLTTSPFRLCFRLEEPLEDREPDPSRKQATPATWKVRYLLQPRSDPSLIQPLEALWAPDEGKRGPWETHQAEVMEYALTALGQAAGICPRIARSLDAACPSGYELDAEGAFQFLSEKAPALEQAGFGVMLPAWWSGKGARLKPRARVTLKSPHVDGPVSFSLDSVIEFDWQVALGGEAMTRQELETLAALKAPLVRFRGQWVEINPDDLAAALKELRKNGSGKARLREAVQMMVGAKPLVKGLEVEELRAEGRLGEMVRKLGGQATLREEETPLGFRGVLRPYQIRGYSWLLFLRKWGLGACLADDMGLGKTIQTLALIQKDRENGEHRPILLICPTSVVNNWSLEARRFTPELPVWIHHGPDRLKGEAFRRVAREHALVVSTYGLLTRESRTLAEVPWAGLVLDEAQNIKNPETKQARTARSIPADYRLALTGTPVENHIGDLWSIMEFLNQGFLGSRAEYRKNFLFPIQAGRDPDAADRLKQLTGPFILRRLKTDKTVISDLPDKIEMKTYCHLTPEQASLYASVIRDVERALTESQGIQRKGLILATLSKLKQVCDHPAHFLGDRSSIPGRSGKLIRLAETLEHILGLGERVLIFTQFVEMGEILKRYLQEIHGFEVLFLHGRVPKTKRDRMVDRFQNQADGPPVFVLSLKAGGTGLNLTRANHVVHFDRWWNPAVENQATDRVFRIGQDKNVTVHKMICLGTLEERIDEMIEHKKEVAEHVVGSGESWLTELSDGQLRDLMNLRENALEV